MTTHIVPAGTFPPTNPVNPVDPNLTPEKPAMSNTPTMTPVFIPSIIKDKGINFGDAKTQTSLLRGVASSLNFYVINKLTQFIRKRDAEAFFGFDEATIDAFNNEMSALDARFETEKNRVEQGHDEDRDYVAEATRLHVIRQWLAVEIKSSEMQEKLMLHYKPTTRADIGYGATLKKMCTPKRVDEAAVDRDVAMGMLREHAIQAQATNNKRNADQALAMKDRVVALLMELPVDADENSADDAFEAMAFDEQLKFAEIILKAYNRQAGFLAARYGTTGDRSDFNTYLLCLDAISELLRSIHAYIKMNPSAVAKLGDRMPVFPEPAAPKAPQHMKL